jgi:hypothetical protein
VDAAVLSRNIVFVANAIAKVLFFPSFLFFLLIFSFYPCGPGGALS